ncbi:MAG: hypothetical protein AAB882_01735 [Patescibacteria group bacterium]
MSTQTKRLFEKVSAWPRERQAIAVDFLRRLERGTGVYVPGVQELRALDRGIAQAVSGSFASPAAVSGSWKAFEK